MSATYPHIPFCRNWTISTETWRKLGECQGYVHALMGMPIMPQERRRLYCLTLAKGAQATTAIEGNTLTLEAVQQLVDNPPTPHMPMKYEEQEVTNVVHAINTITDELLNERRADHLSPELIKSFHKRICENLGGKYQLQPGVYRQQNVTVGQYRPPDYGEVPALVDQLCVWLKQEFHYPDNYTLADGIIQAAVVHYYLNAIHPFSDGNGRTARLIEFYLLLRAGVPDVAAHALTNFYNDNRDDYYRQLKGADQTNDLTQFIAFAVNGLSLWMQEALKLIQRSTFALVWNRFIYTQFDELARGKSLNAAQKRKRELALLFPTDTDKSYTQQTLLDSSGRVAQLYRGLSDRTLARDLAELAALGLLVKMDNAYTSGSSVVRQLHPQQMAGSKRGFGLALDLT